MTSTTSDVADAVIATARDLYGSGERLSLHEPVVGDLEKRYLSEAVDSTFVSSVGEFVDRFEHDIASFVGARRAVVTVNGTAALHAALHALGVRAGDEVITQPLTFVATCNAIRYCGADVTFVDIDEDTLGLSSSALAAFLEKNARREDGYVADTTTGRRISAVVPMHTFGLAARVEEIAEICSAWAIPLVEDAAESIGSRVGRRHTGLFGAAGIFSFNGNKTITTGGGGAILTDDDQLADLLKHLTTTAKTPHPWEYFHDQLGFNYRMPNINAALGCAQLERLPDLLRSKRQVHDAYERALRGIADGTCRLMAERERTVSNYWLNALILPSEKERNDFLTATHNSGVLTRPAWRLMTDLPEYARARRGPLRVSEEYVGRVANVPSSARVVA